MGPDLTCCPLSRVRGCHLVDPKPDAGPRPVCTLSKAFAALAQAGKLPAKQVFNAEVFGHKDRKPGKSEPEWTFEDIQGQSVGRVDATSCALPSDPTATTSPAPSNGGGGACSSDGDCNPGGDGSGPHLPERPLRPRVSLERSMRGAKTGHTGQCR
jgi:hypothetical protein